MVVRITNLLNLKLNTVMILSALQVFLLMKICEARVIAAPSLSVAEPMPHYYFKDIDGHVGTYAFGYDISDPGTDNIQFRREERYPNGTVAGSYGYVDASGKPYRFSYVADHKGYRVFQDLPRKPSRKHAISSFSEYSYGDQSTESSITWTRPSKKKNKKENENGGNKIVNRVNYIERLNDPKYYVKNYFSNAQY